MQTRWYTHSVQFLLSVKPNNYIKNKPLSAVKMHSECFLSALPCPRFSPLSLKSKLALLNCNQACLGHTALLMLNSQIHNPRICYEQPFRCKQDTYHAVTAQHLCRKGGLWRIIKQEMDNALTGGSTNANSISQYIFFHCIEKRMAGNSVWSNL